MEKIFIFFIFLGPLVFFHELGHFLFARLFGVRVEVFSIGFGPKILSFKKGDTQYALSLIPLGGYVKMFGDDPLSEKKLTAEEELVAYTKKGKWARFWIVFGGPLANFILAFFIYFALVSFGEKLPQTKFGVIQPEHKFYAAGLRTGDVLKKINEQEIASFDDFNLIDSEITHMSISRNGVSQKINYLSKGLKFVEDFSGINPLLRAPIVVNPYDQSFLVKTVEGSLVSLEEIFEYPGDTILLEAYAGAIETEFKANLVPMNTNGKKLIREQGKTWRETLIMQDLYPRDLYISNVVMGSAASEANLRKGDLVIAVEGEKIFSFETFKNIIQGLKDKKGKKNVEVTILNKKGGRTLSLTPKLTEHNGQEVFAIGVQSGISFFSFMVEHKSRGFVDAIIKGYYRTKEGMVKTILGFKKLITGEVSLKHVGGPITIGKVASDSYNVSLSMFFRLMALISINLGIINLFPIPVLDGGHIVFIFLELVNGGPLSRKKLMYAQQVGMSLLFVLIFFALFNDISRFF